MSSKLFFCNMLFREHLISRRNPLKTNDLYCKIKVMLNGGDNVKRLFGLSFVLLCIVIMLTGCGEGLETPEEAVTTALNAMKNADRSTMVQYFGEENVRTEEEDLLLEGKEMRDILYKNIVFKTLSSEIKGNIAVVKTEITNIDMKVVVADYVVEGLEAVLTSAFSDKQINEAAIAKQAEKILLDKMKNATDRKRHTVDIKLTRIQGDWKIDIDDALLNAIYGGLYDVLE